ncbi:hypothetical protein GGI13_008167, partial [Coemansia sp. RSA 455]
MPDFMFKLQQQMQDYSHRLAHVEKFQTAFERLQQELTETQDTLAAVLAENKTLKESLARASVTVVTPVSGSGVSGVGVSGVGESGAGVGVSGAGVGVSAVGAVVGSWSGVVGAGVGKKAKKHAPRARKIAARLFTSVPESQGF